jgi:hypothetical protein
MLSRDEGEKALLTLRGGPVEWKRLSGMGESVLNASNAEARVKHFHGVLGLQHSSKRNAPILML